MTDCEDEFEGAASGPIRATVVTPGTSFNLLIVVDIIVGIVVVVVIVSCELVVDTFDDDACRVSALALNSALVTPIVKAS
jgi:hypothetical protein